MQLRRPSQQRSSCVLLALSTVGWALCFTAIAFQATIGYEQRSNARTGMQDIVAAASDKLAPIDWLRQRDAALQPSYPAECSADGKEVEGLPWLEGLRKGLQTVCAPTPDHREQVSWAAAS